MPKSEKVKVNFKERVEDNVCDLSLSELNDVPVREIASYKRVTVLDLSNNRLISLGKNFTILTRLVFLDLSKNQIKYLPNDFGLLRSLRHLVLYDNKIEHLPLSFGNLESLRFLDLTKNPLSPALAQHVGVCLNREDCENAAKNTVRYLARMQKAEKDAEKQKAEKDAEKQKAEKEAEKQLALREDDANVENLEGALNYQVGNKANDQQKSKKTNKKQKSKTKSKVNNNNNDALKENMSKKNTLNENSNNTDNKVATKSTKKSGNGAKKKPTKPSVALTSILTFFVLLAINILIIYLIMFKNLEIADKIVEFIPHQYRDWILTKTEFFRLRVTDWISEFRTPPEEH